MAVGELGYNRAMRRNWRGKLKTRTRDADDEDGEMDYRHAVLVAKRLKAYRQKQVTPQTP